MLTVITHFNNGVTQEDGSLPGEGLTGFQSFTYFFLVPLALFLGISLLTWIFAGKKKTSEESSSVLTQIK